MQTTNRLFDDFSKLIVGIIAIGKSLKTDIAQHALSRAERYASKVNLVTRQEFEVFVDVAQNARLQSENLEERISTLEEKIKKADNNKV